VWKTTESQSDEIATLDLQVLNTVKRFYFTGIYFYVLVKFQKNQNAVYNTYMLRLSFFEFLSLHFA
jgi:hypothetical protein